MEGHVNDMRANMVGHSDMMDIESNVERYESDIRRE